MLLLDYSAILLTCIKRQLVLKNNFWSFYLVDDRENYFALYGLLFPCFSMSSVPVFESDYFTQVLLYGKLSEYVGKKEYTIK